jgi:hypothetical protein
MSLFTYPKFQSPTLDGVNLAGGKVYFYEVGTSTPKDTYTDSGLGTENANPVILNARGEADIWLDGDYKIALHDADDVEVWTDSHYESAPAPSTYKTKAEAAVLTLTSKNAGKKIFITSADGGEFTVRYDVTAPYADNSGAFCGTVFIPTGGDGTIGFVRDYSGKINIKWFGAKVDGSTEDTSSVILARDALTSGGSIYFPSGTTILDTLSFVGFFDFNIEGDGTSSILDFKNVTTARGLDINNDVADGGFQRIRIKDIQITDSRSTSTVTELLALEGGATGASPSRVGGFVSLENVYFGKHANSTGTTVLLRNISQVKLSNVYEPFINSARYGILIDNDVDINTGVIETDNCMFVGSVHGFYLKQTLNLLDTFTVKNCFIGNHINVSALEAVRIESVGVIESLNFVGNHIECKHASLESTMKFTGGTIAASTIENNHFSSGTATDQNIYGILFDNVTVLGSRFSANEFLRVKSSGSSGRCYYFKNTCTLNPDEPTEIKGVYRNSSTPGFLEVESGGNEDIIHNGLVVNPMEYARVFTIATTDTVLSITPPREEFLISVGANNNPTRCGVVWARVEPGGSAVTLIGGGSNFVTGTGIPTGTTGAVSSLGVYAHTDGRIYIENRSGTSIQFTLNYLQGYFGNP